MNIIVIILLVLAGFIALILVVALFIKKELIVTREVTINKPKQVVFEYIKFIKNHDNFSVWARMDPDMKREYRGTDGTVGFVLAWESFKSKNVGKGEQEIKKITDGTEMEFELRFETPFKSVAKSYMKLSSVAEDKTQVKWILDSEMKYPMNIMLLFLNMDEMLGKDLKTGLANLKEVLEK